MATKKKPKKKAVQRKARKARKVSTDSTLVFELLTRVEGMVRALVLNQTAQREAIERLDLTVARGLADVAAHQQIDPTLYPGPQDGGVPDRVATIAVDAVDHKSAVAVYNSPTDVELLS